MLYQCDTPGCRIMIPSYNRKKSVKGYYFCRICREKHSLSVLAVQAEHGKSIQEVLLDASSFQNAVGMADYIGVSFVTIYNWVASYFSISFQEFRRQHVCGKTVRNACYSLDISRSAYSRHDYVLKKLRMRRYCACVDVTVPNQIRTNAPLDVVQSILKGNPHIERVAEGEFALRPLPVHIHSKVPLYIENTLPDEEVDLPVKRPNAAKSSKGKSGEGSEGSLTFRDRVFLALYSMGGSAEVQPLREVLSKKYHKVYRVNNTRREVYRKPDMAFFSGENSQTMNLTPKGLGYVLHVLSRHLYSSKNS